MPHAEDRHEEAKDVNGCNEKGNEKKGEANLYTRPFPARDSRTETPGNHKAANGYGDRVNPILRFANPAFSNRTETTNDPFPGCVRN
ncbi:hypothetical protein EYR40_009689 [Pleurotus pulmonarius]|nr:hypothetical protein EYR38_002728 [Pleurotus pulmonarius]KAF4581405.1 hypothetical protein EYR38_002731 [Pleurotus pulmonarius]KAF4591088.1 hypothetical protein EYR40_009688 [Pleurotus pulmonarius]KAF4591089.1 hypothetical protein EYR40_009689 [Pleurotus pulmonarius]